MSLAAGALRRPVTTVAVTLGFVLLGAVSLGQLPVSLLPDVSLPVLTIRTSYPGAAATEVSRFIAEPIEEAVAATPGIVDLRSVSRNGEAVTTLRFSWGTNMATTVLQVRERLDNARANLPERAERPTLLTSDPGERPIAVLGLTGPGDLRSIARTAADVHARRLEQLAGVASVAVVGDPKDEIRVDIDPEKARALGITPSDISNAVKAANAGAPGGTIRRGQFRFALRALTEFQDAAEVARTPVGPARSGITLGDIGVTSLGTADPQTMTRLDGRPAVGLVVYKDAGANTVAVTEAIYGIITTLGKEFPDITIKVVAAQAQFVSDALGNLWQEIVVGGLLSLVVIVLFLRDWRGSIAIALIIPLSVLTALTLLQLLNVTVNILSLGGLALGIGLLVDNAIVVAEATGRYKEQGLADRDAAQRATEEVTAPLFAGTLTSVLVFGPIVFVRGLAAALFRDLSLSVVVTLSTALVLALTLMPVMMVRWGKRSEVRDQRSDPSPRTSDLSPLTSDFSPLTSDLSPLTRLGHWCAEKYEAGMAWALGHHRTVFLSSALIAGFTVWVALQLPREILPSVDEGIAVAQMTLPQGTAIEETARQTARLEQAAKELGSSGIYSRVGKATDEEVLAGADPGTSATAQLIIPVPDGQSGARFAERLRSALPDLAQGALAIDLAGQSEFGSLIGREGRLVRVEVSAPKLEEAARWADSVRRLLEPLKTLADVRDAFSTTQPTVEVTLLRQRIAEYGLSVDAVANALAGGLGGVASGEFRETDRRTPITVRFAGNANEDLPTALATPLRGIPVGQLVSVREIRAPVEVVRINQRPVSVIEAVVEKGGTARANRDVGAAVATLSPPPGVTWQIAGADAEQQRTTKELSLVAILSAALMYLVLAGEFASFTTPLLVMLTVPLAAAGGLIFLWLTGQSLNAVSLIGMVVMIGMADNEAVVKLDAIRRFREQGHSIEESVLLGGRQRLRAIAMTSITTVTGVLPLLFGWGSGGALYQPLAAGVIGGSVSALGVTFFLLPTAYAWLERRKAGRAQAAGRRELPDMIRWASTRPAVIWAFGMALMLAGGMAFARLPLATKTAVELPRLTVSSSWPGASADLIETYITSPIEAAIQGVRGVRKTSSTSGERGSTINVDLEADADVQLTRLAIHERLELLRKDFPPGVAAPQVYNFVPEELSEQPLLQYSLAGPYTPGTLSKLTQEQLTPRITSVAGVSSVSTFGRATVGVSVSYDVQRLRQLDISPALLTAALADARMVQALGEEQAGATVRSVVLRDQPHVYQDLEQLPIRAPSGRVFALGELAAVRPEEDTRGFFSRLDGVPKVGLEINRLPGADVIQTAARVREAMSEIQRILPPGVTVKLESDESVELGKELNDLLRRGGIAFLAVTLVLLVGMRKVRSVALVMGSAAIAIAGTALGLYLFNVPANLLTIAGLGMGIGILVQDGIVVVDRLRRVEDSAAARAAAGSRIARAVVGSTLTTLVVLIPFLYLQGNARAAFVPFAMAFGLALIWSVISSVIMIPSVGSGASGRPTWTRLGRFYSATLTPLVRWRWVTIGLTVVLLGVVTWGFVKRVPRSSFGNYFGQRTTLGVNLSFPRGSDPESLDRGIQEFERIAVGRPGVEKVESRGGGSYANLQVTFTKDAALTAIPAMMEEEMTERAVLIGGASVSVRGQGPGFFNGAGGSSVAYRIKLLGYSFSGVERLAKDLQQRLEAIPRVRNVNINAASFFGSERAVSVILTPDRPALSRAGVTSRDFAAAINREIRGAAGGTRLEFDGEETEVSVKATGARERSLEELRTALVPNASGSPVRVSDLAEVGEREGLATISREDQQYVRIVGYDFRGPVKLANRTHEAFMKSITAPAGYAVSDDKFTWQEDDSAKGLWLVFAAGVIFVILAVAMVFDSVWAAAMVFLSLPLCLGGVAAVFWATGTSFSREAAVGVILVVGLAVHQAILLVDAALEKRRHEGPREGADAAEPTLRIRNRLSVDDIVAAASDRAGMIMLVTLTTLASLIPLAVGTDTDSLFGSIALATAGGTIAGTIGALWIVPAYLVSRRRRATATSGPPVS